VVETRSCAAPHRTTASGPIAVVLAIETLRCAATISHPCCVNVVRTTFRWPVSPVPCIGHNPRPRRYGNRGKGLERRGSPRPDPAVTTRSDLAEAGSQRPPCGAPTPAHCYGAGPKHARGIIGAAVVTGCGTETVRARGCCLLHSDSTFGSGRRIVLWRWRRTSLTRMLSKRCADSVRPAYLFGGAPCQHPWTRGGVLFRRHDPSVSVALARVTSQGVAVLRRSLHPKVLTHNPKVLTHNPKVLTHNPKVLAMADGRWVVVCTECDALSHRQEPPIGIKMPLESRLTAERLRKNHASMAALGGGPTYPWPTVKP